MTKLEGILHRMLRLDGPMRLDRFMALVVEHYYANHHVFGAAGDFITAPEISPCFAQVISNWLYELWERRGRGAMQLVELGPGNGTLMHDLLRGNDRYPGLSEAIKTITMIERSKELVDRQKQKLSHRGDKVVWQDSIRGLDDVFTVVIANEFFDALPIRQWINEEDGLSEIYVSLDAESNFKFVKTPVVGQLFKGSVNHIIEFSPQLEMYGREISATLQEKSGAALIIDYGYIEPITCGTLQAVKAHKYHQLLCGIGEADWTAHVNFARLLEVMRGGSIFHEVSTQGDFLKRFGIEDMLPVGSDSLLRLTDRAEMGELFKVLFIEY